MPDAIQDFLSDLRIKGRSELTLKNYELHLLNFVSWCRQTGTGYLSLTPRQAKQYRDALYASGLADKTINCMIGTLRGFYEFLMEEEQIQGNPILRGLHIREKPSYPNPLSDWEQHVILEVLESKPYHIRLAFRVMLTTGIRVGEAARLTGQDVGIQQKRVVLYIRHAKGDKSRMVPVTDSEVAQELLEYAKSVPEGEPLFRVSKRTLQGHAENIKKRTGINFYAHRTRHTFATNLLANGTRLDVIQRVMGHADISTTRRYAETASKDILAIADPIELEGEEDKLL